MEQRMSTEEIHARHQLLAGRAKGALGRLLKVRESLLQAESSKLDPNFRDELLQYIDRGY